MSLSVTEIVTLVSALIAVFTSIQAGRSSRAGNRKTDADTAARYQEIADHAAETQLAMQKQIDELIRRMDGKDVENVELKEIVNSRNVVIVELRDAFNDQSKQIRELNDLLSAKDNRIAELERQTAEQATEIEQLRGEIKTMRDSQGISR